MTLSPTTGRWFRPLLFRLERVLRGFKSSAEWWSSRSTPSALPFRMGVMILDYQTYPHAHNSEAFLTSVSMALIMASGCSSWRMNIRGKSSLRFPKRDPFSIVDLMGVHDDVHSPQPDGRSGSLYHIKGLERSDYAGRLPRIPLHSKLVWYHPL